MPLRMDQRQRLIDVAGQEGVDANELIREAEAMADVHPTQDGAQDGKRGAADRLLIGFLHWVKVSELRERLGFTERIEGDEEICTAYAIKRGMIAKPGGVATAEEGDDGTEET